MSNRQFGTIRQLPSGRWQVRYRHSGSNRLTTAPSTFPSKAQASRWLSGVETDQSRADYIEPDGGDMTLHEYSEVWMTQRILRPRTVELYRGLLDHHILPWFGDTSLAKLTPALIRSWHADLVSAGRPGPSTVAKSYRLLRTICETAVQDEMITRNPCNLKGASTERSAERPVLSLSQLADVVGAIDERYRGMVLLAAWCGLRLGELLALTRGDVDLVAGTVRVDKSAAELSSGERIVGPPKTAAGRRVIAIPPHITASVEAHLERFAGRSDDDVIFVGPKGRPLRRASFYTEWQRASKKAGLNSVHFHDLRHTGATLAAATGATTRELMNRLGHASSQAALRYQHATADRDIAIAKALSQLAVADDGIVMRLPSEI
jgi:integrase